MHRCVHRCSSVWISSDWLRCFRCFWCVVTWKPEIWNLNVCFCLQVFLKIEEKDVENALKDRTLLGSILAAGLPSWSHLFIFLSHFWSWTHEARFSQWFVFYSHFCWELVQLFLNGKMFTRRFLYFLFFLLMLKFSSELASVMKLQHLFQFGFETFTFLCWK